jgi:L-seryl-tRNA(Ser) seleniumtransferase
LPSVDAVLEDERIKRACLGVARKLVVDSIRGAVDAVRAAALAGEIDGAAIGDAVVDGALASMAAGNRPQYRRAINAAGIILHTGLGRAVLPQRALDRIAETMKGYSVLQIGPETGKRSKRDGRIEWLLGRLTGAEAATVVNNNAAATALVLNTVGAGKEVIVSRGQLVEIGGAFRLPDVMAFSGAKMVEVGTTNKTHARDYADAITEETAAILRVHPSNYKIQGFSSEVPLDEMIEIAHSNGLALIDDIGSGALIDFSRFGFEPEPTLPDSIEKGADLVTSSADKLIGSAQGGVIAGKAEWVEKVRKNQFARIVRADKLTLAAIEATLELFLDEATALSEVPTLEMMLRDGERIGTAAKRIASQAKKAVGADAAEISTAAGFSQMGSGSLPAQNLATTLVAVAPKKMGAESLAKALRMYEVAIFTRIANDQVLIDPRTLREGDDKVIIGALAEILGG